MGWRLLQDEPDASHLVLNEKNLFSWRPQMFGSRSRIKPGPGQESVWDYPRPPALERVPERLRVVFAGQTIADTQSGYRVLETSHPPVYYIPPADVRLDVFKAAAGSSFCEFKGRAQYWSIDLGGRRSERAAWSYPDPSPKFRDINDYLAFYASRVDECWVGDERVEAQEGDFYGGWITAKVVGPFKGGPGTFGW
jgi:uncharacterized protein (DUF427 family)